MSYVCPRKKTESALTYKTLVVPKQFDCWAALEAQSTSCFVRTKMHCLFYIAHIHQMARDYSVCTLYSVCIASHRFQVVLLKKWESIIGTQALHIIFIFIWGITPHRPDNLAPQIPSLSVLWSHSGWSPGWADSAWKAALFNEQWRAWVKRQQVER